MSKETDALRKEASKIELRVREIRQTLLGLEENKRRKELQGNVGKYFVERTADTCKRYFYVIGVDKEATRNTVLSIVGSGTWIQFECSDTPFSVNDMQPITRKDFLKQMERVKLIYNKVPHREGKREKK